MGISIQHTAARETLNILIFRFARLKFTIRHSHFDIWPVICEMSCGRGRAEDCRPPPLCGAVISPPEHKTTRVNLSIRINSVQRVNSARRCKKRVCKHRLFYWGFYHGLNYRLGAQTNCPHQPSHRRTQRGDSEASENFFGLFVNFCFLQIFNLWFLSYIHIYPLQIVSIKGDFY